MMFVHKEINGTACVGMNAVASLASERAGLPINHTDRNAIRQGLRGEMCGFSGLLFPSQEMTVSSKRRLCFP